jgi:hypothetical protein
MAIEARKAVIVSGIAPSYVGGLGAYQRFLARALQEHFGIEGVFLAVKPEHPSLEKSDEPVPWPVKTLEVRPVWTKAQRVLSSMASRPLLHPLLEHLAGWLVPAASFKRVDGMGDWIHFVGTGWDFGLPLDWARRRGTMIWAVYPRSWGCPDIVFMLARILFSPATTRVDIAAFGVSERSWSVRTAADVLKRRKFEHSGDSRNIRLPPAVLFLAAEMREGYPVFESLAHRLAKLCRSGVAPCWPGGNGAREVEGGSASWIIA